MRKLAAALAGLAVAALFALGAALAFGGPRAPPPMGSIRRPFDRVDMSDVPTLATCAARDGERLAYRTYLPAGSPRGSAVLVHGSSARSQSMHALARALARAGIAAYALDVRGHGQSGPKGRIRYVGQLENDLEDFVAAVAPPAPRTLVGFSSGGGFALRFAGDRRQALFQRYVLLAPFVHQDAPTYRAEAGGWAAIGLPRIIATSVLNRAGIHAFDELPVTAFALDAHDAALLTPTYSFALAMNFRPHDDWRGDLRRARQPMAVLVGAEDEVFVAERFAEVFADGGKRVPVTIVPGVGHIGLTTAPAGTSAVVAAVRGVAAASAR